MKRVALITGGSRGIGLGIAKQLAMLGFDIAINGVRPAADIVEIIETIKAFGSDVIYCQGNISVLTDRNKILVKIKDHLIG